MANYDFTTLLSPLDFEVLSKDLLEAELGIRLENFREGKDQGIDLRYAPGTTRRGSTVLRATRPILTNKSPEIIVQCKRYSSYNSLKSELKNNEWPKIAKLKPARYILTTSLPLSPSESSNLKKVLAPYVQSTDDIYGKERLNSILSKHAEIERRHIKLWVNSVGVLDAILHAKTHVVSREEVERTIAAAKLYVRNPSFDEALEILKKEKVCIISGLPGIGKTTLARMLLLYFFRRDYDIIKIESDVSEANEVAYHDRPRFYYYDDFLGQTAKADKLNKNEDQKLLDFMRSVHDSKESLLVLTTREYILNQAKLYYEKLNREKFDHRICVVDLSKYSRKIRAQILYNHLYFSELPKTYLGELVSQRGYLKIVDHKNYNPRLIEFLTSPAWVGEVPPASYFDYFIASLENPATLWEHAYSYQISEAARNLLLVLVTLPPEVLMSHLESGFRSLHNKQCAQTGMVQSSGDFKKALKELDGTFIHTRKLDEYLIIRFQNPSIRDFMRNLLLSGDILEEVIDRTIFFEQIQWLWANLSDSGEQKAAKRLSTLRQRVCEKLESLWESESCSLSVVEIGSFRQVDVVEADRVFRLAEIGDFAKRMEWMGGAKFVDEKIEDLANFVEGGEKWILSSIEALQKLGDLGYLLSENGRRLSLALIAQAVESLVYVADFDKLARLTKMTPKLFDKEEIDKIRGEFSDFVKRYAEEYEEGENDEEDPTKIRSEANCIEQIGNILGVDVSGEYERINDYAEEKEKEAEKNRNWDRDDDNRGSGNTEACSDAEIDSMFRTLET